MLRTRANHCTNTSTTLLELRRKHCWRCRPASSPGKLRHGGCRHASASTADLCDQIVLLSLALSFALATTSLLRVAWNKALVIVLSNQEVSAELLALLAVPPQRI